MSGSCRCGKEMFLYKQREEIRAYFCPHCNDYLIINPYTATIEYCKAEDISIIDLDKRNVVYDRQKHTKRKK